MKDNILIYPVIVTECNDEAGHYYGVTSPNIQGMVTDGKTLTEAIEHAEDAIATMISDTEYPAAQDPRSWELEENDSIMWVTVNMRRWLNDYGKTVRRNVTIPESLNEWAKLNNVNVSKVTTEALKELANIKKANNKRTFGELLTNYYHAIMIVFQKVLELCCFV